MHTSFYILSEIVEKCNRKIDGSEKLQKNPRSFPAAGLRSAVRIYFAILAWKY